MPFPFLVPLALTAGSAIAGALGRKKSTQTTTTGPTLDPAFRGIQDVLVQNALKRLQSPSALPAGIAERNTSDINSAYDAAGTNLSNSLTARGLGTSPIAGAGLRRLQTDRAGAIVQMKQGLPLLERQFQQGDLANALALLNMGRGQTSTTTGPSGQPGGLQGGISGLASMLGFLYGSGAFGGAGAGGGAPWSSAPFSPYQNSMYVGL